MKKKIISFLKRLICSHNHRIIEAVTTEEDGWIVTRSTYTCEFCGKVVREHKNMVLIEPIYIKIKPNKPINIQIKF